jgi:hypothetical protein
MLLPWFGGAATPAIHAVGASGNSTPLSIHTSLPGWQAFTTQRWLWLLTGLFALGVVALRAAGRPLSLPVAPAAIVAVLGGLSTLCIAFRCLYHPHAAVAGAALQESFGIEFGAWLGLAAAAAITLGAYRSLIDDHITPRDLRDQLTRVLNGEFEVRPVAAVAVAAAEPVAVPSDARAPEPETAPVSPTEEPVRPLGAPPGPAPPLSPQGAIPPMTGQKSQP